MAVTMKWLLAIPDVLHEDVLYDGSHLNNLGPLLLTWFNFNASMDK